MVALEPRAALAPDGSKSADWLVETSDYGRHRIETAVHGATAGAIHTLSVFVKPVERLALQFEMRDQRPGKLGVVQFNFRDKAVTYAGGDISGAGMQVLPDGWFRCWAAMPYFGDTAVFNIAMLGMHAAVEYRGSSSAGLLIWGTQFEPGVRPRGYAGAESRTPQ